MKKFLRRVRGAVGMGLTWAFAWFAAGIALLLVVGPDAADVPFPIGFAMFGFLAGATFSTVLGITEGRRRFEQLSIPRFALWGAVGGVLLSVAFVLLADVGGGALVVLAPVFALASAASAAGSLTLARRGGDGALLGDGEDMDLIS